MGPPATRFGDETVGICDLKLPCCPHGRVGTNQKVSPNVFINGLGAHRRTDTGPTNCPHSGTFESVEASSTVFFNGLGCVRIGDMTVCQACGEVGHHSTGSPNVFVGG
jgi:uncharacterized Zn-binding protein involved in type VI secretion